MQKIYANPPQSKAELIERIRAARGMLEDLIQPMPAVLLTRPGADGGWSIQDHLAHLAAWRWKLLAMIHGHPGSEGLGLDQETYQNAGIDGINAILYERSRGSDTEAVLADFRRAHEEVLDAIEKLDPADLRRAYDLTDPTDTRLLLEGIIGNTYEHDLEHFGWIQGIIDSEAHI